MTAPRLVTRALVRSFLTVALVLGAVFAMTSVRAYRAARLPVEAIAELRRCAGTDFDGPSVEALVVAVPRLVGALAPLDLSAFQWAQRSRTA